MRALLIACLEYLLRILYTAPGHLGDVKQTVSAAKIDECTEISYVLTHPLPCHLAWIFSKRLFLKLSFLSNHKLLSVADDSSSLGIELSDHEFDILTSILG